MDPKIKEPQASVLRVITEQISNAIEAPKCHPCGCFHKTVEALANTSCGQRDIAPLISQARAILQTKQYDCLGCPVCYPAIAANALAEAYPEAGAGLDFCPTEEQEERLGWPPLPGDYTVIRYGAPVAVCALNSEPLVRDLAESKPDGLAIVGTLRTENLGIERVIKNTLTNPHIRFLLLCGEDTRQAVGHLPGQSFESLFRSSLDERGRIIGARGKRPVLKNVNREEVEAFTQQVELVAMIGEENPDRVGARIRACAERNPGTYPYPFKAVPIERVEVAEPKPLMLDRAGYFVVYPDHRPKHLVVEHYTNQGLLTCVLEGSSTGALYGEAIERQLLTRLDHAAYLGRELARAERSLQDGTPFVQDAAPGELAAPKSTSGTASSCACTPGPQTTRLPTRKGKWIGLAAVLAVAFAIIGYKARSSPRQQAASAAAPPRVLLVANMSEADSPGDACAEIIHLVHAARERGIAVQELSPGSKSGLLARYHVLTIPTVLILDPNGKVVSRYEGEAQQTVAAIRSQLERLH